MLIRKFYPVALMLLLTTCASTGTNPDYPRARNYCPPPDPRAACAGWEPIITHGKDLQVMDPRTVEEIDAHNRHGLDMGCWKSHA